MAASLEMIYGFKIPLLVTSILYTNVGWIVVE